MAKNWMRWAPAVAVPAVIAGVVVISPLAANAAADLPDKTPSEVLGLVAKADVSAFSGTIDQSSDLGLPDLSGVGSLAPGGGQGGGADDGSGDAPGSSELSSALELLTGSHQARVYVDGDDKARLQVLDTMAERDVIRSGDDLWFYDSDSKTAVHTSIGSDEHAPTGAVPTPTELADRFLSAIDPSTAVTVGSDVTVAGRSAYDLVLTPKSDDTLVGSVSIAVDGKTGLPLRVEVTASGASSPALSVAFSSLSLDTPSADLFAFTPPAGTTVTEKDAPDRSDLPKHGDASGDAASRPQIVAGSGWDSIVEVPLGADAAELTASPLLGELTTPVDGGHLLQSTLVNVLLTDDGRILAGSVSPDALEAAAAAE